MDKVNEMDGGNIYVVYQKLIREVVQECQGNPRMLNKVAAEEVLDQVLDEIDAALWARLVDDLDLDLYPQARDLSHLPRGEVRRWEG